MATLAAIWVFGASAPASGDVLENFESPDPSLQLADADCAAEIVSQQRVFQQAHGGAGCERVVLRAGRGTRVYLEQALTPAQVIDELKIHLWVKGDRPGFQLIARVVFPKSLDPRTGQPLSTLVWGSSYRDVGAWQLLSITDLPKLVQRQVRVLTSERGEPVDARQAYIDKIVINAYGGNGVTQLWVDELDVEGHATPLWWRGDMADQKAKRAVPWQATVGKSATSKIVKTSAASAAAASLAASREEPPVRLQGSVLVARERPLFVRGVVYHGESLSWLKSLGFNVILFPGGATAEQRAAAAKLELWIITPPQAAAPSVDETGHDHVLAELRQKDGSGNVVAVHETVSLNRRLSLAWIATTSQEGLRDAPAADLLLADLGGGVPGWDSSAGLSPEMDATFTKLAANRPTWKLVDTELLVAATRLETRGDATLRQQQFKQALRVDALRSLACGARGWCLSNALPESLADADVPRWTAALEQVQRELELIQPWAAAGISAAPLADPAPGWRACALEANRSRLLIVYRDTAKAGAATAELRGSPPAVAHASWGRTARQYVSASVPAVPLLDVVDSGAPTSCDAYLVSGKTPRLLERQRVAGGVRVRLEAPEQVALLVLTQDPLVVSYLARRAAAP